MVELRRQAGDGGVDGHVCRVDLPAPADLGRALFPLVHKTGRIGLQGLSGQAVNVVLGRRAADAGYTAAQIAKLGGHSLRAGVRDRGAVGSGVGSPRNTVYPATARDLSSRITVNQDLAGRSDWFSTMMSSSVWSACHRSLAFADSRRRTKSSQEVVPNGSCSTDAAGGSWARYPMPLNG